MVILQALSTFEDERIRFLEKVRQEEERVKQSESDRQYELLRQRYIVNECYDLERSMGNLADYFDYERFGRELFAYDYQMGANNNVFRVL